MLFHRSMCQAVARSKHLKAKTLRQAHKANKGEILSRNLNFHQKVKIVQDDFFGSKGLVHVSNAARAYLINHHIPKTSDYFEEVYEESDLEVGFKSEDSASKARYHVDIPIPKFFLTVNYPTSVVYYGNHLKPQQCIFEPQRLTVSSNFVEHKWDQIKQNYYTLYMGDLDGNLYSFKENFCHWLVCNVKLEKKNNNNKVAELDLKCADTVFKYVPPVPWEGTGHHRIAFVLYKQKDRIATDEIEPDPEHEFVRRSVDQKNILKIMDSIKSVESYSWFQCEYDLSVSNTCKYVLKVQEPMFEVEPVIVEKGEFQKQFSNTSKRAAIIGHYLREQNARRLVNRGETRIADLEKYYDSFSDRMAGTDERGFDDELDREVEEEL